ncbi:hypothetical protein IMSAGC020_02653 [Lachnospiraceae bacterium]|nr:hypothetical protein IMSAGC020_02653 [Lachnospiraceae bacterium]
MLRYYYIIYIPCVKHIYTGFIVISRVYNGIYYIISHYKYYILLHFKFLR